MTHIKYSVVVLWLVGALFCAMAPLPILSNAYAQDYGDEAPEPTPTESDLQTVGGDGAVMRCSEATDHEGVALGRGALLGRIMPCLVFTVQEATIRFAAEMVELFRPLLYSFLTLVVILFGVRVLQNEPQIYKQGFILVLKLALVLGFLNDLGSIRSISNEAGTSQLIPSVYSIMNESQTVVAATIDTTSLTCDVDTYNNGQTIRVWSIMDCIMGKMFGVTVGDDGRASMLLSTSMIGLTVGFLFGGAWGAVVFFGMMGVLLGLFMLVVRTATVFITSYLMVCLMIIISPLFMPLVFLQGTTGYFERFWKRILAGFLTPIIVIAYVMMALMVYDRMLFRPDSMVQEIFRWEAVEQALEPHKTLLSHTYTNDAEDVRLGEATTLADRQALMRTPTLWNLMIPSLSGGGVGGMKVPAINFEQLGENFQRGRESFMQIFEELVTLVILGWLINQGLNALPKLVNILTQSRVIMSGGLVASTSKAEQGFVSSGRSAFERMREGFSTGSSRSGALGSVDGEQFAARASSVGSDANAAFMNAMQRNARGERGE